MTTKIKVVLCWHMHQPEYRDPTNGVYQQPWTYLHGIKDYVDMVAHLERHPSARAVVNFVPILLEQLDDYAAQIASWRSSGDPGDLRDPLLVALAAPEHLVESEERIAVVHALMRANEERIIRRFDPLNELIDIGRSLLTVTDEGSYISDAFIGDLAIWYHLGWMAETVRRTHPDIKKLMKRARGFGAVDRHLMLNIIGDLLAGLFDRYRQLAQSGRIELSMTPYAHPIMPLLLDMRAGTEADPHSPQPEHVAYPQGGDRVLWHLEHGADVFEKYFGLRPTGCWPSEGAISEQTVHALSRSGYGWLASGGQVLANSLTRQGIESEECLHRVWQFDHLAPAMFFRDDGLSDLVGFDYQSWHAEDAVADLIHHLQNIRSDCDGQDAVVSIILDGENAWEHYPDNGFWFLDQLYSRLSEHPNIELTTFTDVVKQSLKRSQLKHVVAGSWVYGSLSTWVGSPDKNRAWDLLINARMAYERCKRQHDWSPETEARNRQQLAICEGSDWFWWFGDYNPGDAVRDFDRLFRLQLTRLYELMGEPVPAVLAHPLSSGGGTPEGGGVMRRGH